MIARGAGAPAEDDITVRSSRPGEEELLGQTAYASFREGEAEPWIKYYRDNTHRAPDDTLVAEIDGRVAGHATALRLEMSLCGVDVPLRGVAAVAVLPDHRRRGVADRLMREWLRRMHRRGEALSGLYPFSAPFYRKFGYGTVEWSERVMAAPRQLPASPLRRNVRTMDRIRDANMLRRVYHLSRAGTTGPLVRSDYWWQARIFGRVPDGVVYVDPGSNRMQGYLFYEIPKEPHHPGQHVLVRELTALTPDAFRGLIGFLEALGEQVAMIRMDFPRGHGAHLLLTPELGNVPSPFPVPAAYLTGGAMARLVDVPAALALHPGPRHNRARGRIGLDLSDPVISAQARPHDLMFTSKGVHMEGGRTARDRISLSVDRLAQIYFGSSSARALLAQGMIIGSERAADLLDRAFAGPPLFLRLTNFF